MEKSVSSSSETSLVEEWETASSGSGSLSPSIGAKIEGEVAPSGEEVMSGDGATSVDQTDEGNGHQMASRQPSDGTLKRRMGSSRFRIFQRQISTNLDDSDSHSDEARDEEAEVFEQTTPETMVTMKETPCDPENTELILATTEDLVASKPESIVTMTEMRSDHGDTKFPMATSGDLVTSSIKETKPESIVTMTETPSDRGNTKFPMATAKELMGSSIEEIDLEIDRRLSKLTGLLEDLSEMTGHKVTVDRDKVMSEVITKVDPSFRLGSLSKEHGTKTDTKKEEKEESAPDSNENEDKLGQLVQRCVIVQKDEKGYGLTVSGDNPVFVQSVKDMGAAARAGVQQGDKIIKVNGTLVTNSNHVEVVKLIKSGSYVALTLLGRPPGTPQKIPGGGGGPLPDPASPTSPGPVQHSPTSPIERTTASDRISGPRKVDEKQDKELKTQKIATIRMMYEQVAGDYQKLKAEISRSPAAAEALMEKLNDKGKVLQTLEEQLYQLTGIHAETHSGGLRSPPPLYMPPTPACPPPAPVPMRRFGSGDHINTNSNTSQEGPTSPLEGGDNVYNNQTSQSRSANPTPWLVHGSRHAKTNSMPETFYELDEVPPGKPVTVSRSHSDSKKRERVLSAYGQIKEGASEEEIEKLRTSSLPSGISQAGRATAMSIVDTSPRQQSPAGSPPTSHVIRDAWEGMSDEDAEQEKPGMNMSPSPEARPMLQVVTPSQVNVISMEDEEFSTDDEHLDDHGPFSDLNVLKHRPAHLAVFLHYLFSNSDPSPLFFYLVTETYTQGNMKEMRKWAYEIHSTFLVEKAPLRVNVDDGIVSNIDNILQMKYDNENALRCVFQLARHIAQNEISEMLADFRNRRALGLGSLYGDHELHGENMDRQAELRIVEKYLSKNLEILMNSSEESDRNQAMLSALATFFRQVGVPISNKNASSTQLERCQSFVAKDRKVFPKFKSKQKLQLVRGHSFQPQHYYTTTVCNHCTTNLWGVGYQGYQCDNCEYNAHRQCVDKVRDTCSGSKSKKQKRQSVLEKIIRKPSSNNPAAIKEAQRWHSTSDEGTFTSPTQSSSLFNIRSAIRDDEDEELEKIRGGSRVQNLVQGFGSDGVTRSREDLRLPPTPPPHNHRSPDNTDTDDHNDVNVDENTLKIIGGQTGLSGNYIAVTGYPNSTGSEESGFHSSETIASTDIHTTHHHKPSLSWTQDDSDFELEPELPPLDATIPKDVLNKLKPKEKKRQDVINELFYTEKAHVRNLKVMHKLFCQAMLAEPWIPDDLVKLLFPNIEEMIKVHGKLNNSFKKNRKANEGGIITEVAQSLLNSFEGEQGETFKNACAIFCRNQTHTLDMLRIRTRKDQKFAMFLQDICGNPLCRRLELKDLIPTAMQRLTKYPLLIENLLKHTTSTSDEYELLQRAHACSKEILNYVNQAVRDCENHQKLVNFQRRLDKRSIENSTHPVILEYKNLDMTRHKMLYDGALTWRISRSKQIDLHVILLEDILVLLQKQDDKLLLKCQSTTVVSGREDTKFTHSPIIKLSNLLTRNVATDRRAFFLVSTSDVGPQIYELVAPSLEEKKKWFKHITEAAESYKGKEKPAHRRSVRKAGSSGSVNEEAVAGEPGETGEAPPDEQGTPGEEDEMDRQRKDSKEEGVGLLERHTSSSVDSVENLEQAEVLHINQSADLIQPSEVHVNDTMVMVERAEPVLSDQEMLVEKDRFITKAIEEKQNLVAQILNVPLQDFQHVAEMATEDEGEKGARELLLAAIYQATQLTSLINASLNLHTATTTSTVTMHSHSSHSNGTDADQQQQQQQQQQTVQEPPAVVRATPEERLQDSGGSDVTSQGAAAEASGSDALTVSLPCRQVNTVASRLNQHLNQLLEVMNRREKEQERLQQQLKITTEQLSRLQDASPLQHSSSQPTSRPDSFVSSASEPGESDTCPGHEDGLPPGPLTDQTALLNASSSESPKLTPIVVSHVVTSAVAVEKLATLTINDPSENVMTSTPATVTSEGDAADSQEDADAAGSSDASDASSAGSEGFVTSQQVDDVTNTDEIAELV